MPRESRRLQRVGWPTKEHFDALDADADVSEARIDLFAAQLNRIEAKTNQVLIAVLSSVTASAIIGSLLFIIKK